MRALAVCARGRGWCSVARRSTADPTQLWRDADTPPQPRAPQRLRGDIGKIQVVASADYGRRPLATCAALRSATHFGVVLGRTRPGAAAGLFDDASAVAGQESRYLHTDPAAGWHWAAADHRLAWRLQVLARGCVTERSITYRNPWADCAASVFVVKVHFNGDVASLQSLVVASVHFSRRRQTARAASWSTVMSLVLGQPTVLLHVGSEVGFDMEAELQQQLADRNVCVMCLCQRPDEAATGRTDAFFLVNQRCSLKGPWAGTHASAGQETFPPVTAKAFSQTELDDVGVDVQEPAGPPLLCLFIGKTRRSTAALDARAAKKKLAGLGASAVAGRVKEPAGSQSPAPLLPPHAAASVCAGTRGSGEHGAAAVAARGGELEARRQKRRRECRSPRSRRKRTRVAADGHEAGAAAVAAPPSEVGAGSARSQKQQPRGEREPPRQPVPRRQQTMLEMAAAALAASSEGGFAREKGTDAGGDGAARAVQAQEAATRAVPDEAGGTPGRKERKRRKESKRGKEKKRRKVEISDSAL